MSKKSIRLIVEIVAVMLAIVIFGVPFYFVLVNSFKTQSESAELSISWPKELHIIENYKKVLETQNGIVIRAFYNSTIITAISIVLLILICSMAGFVMQRRSSRASSFIDFMVLAGLMIPPAIVPTIWVLQGLRLFKTLPGIILIEAALNFPFCTMLYRQFMATIPREIDESAIIDGASGLKLFFNIVFPLLQPVTATITVTSAVGIFNDFVNPLYFLPGAKNATVQLTLYNFMGQFLTSWNLLFADVVLIIIPPLILFIFFNKQIVGGMTAGSLKA
ncbi:carbohydrate ABC transporter permease [Mahella australiensis]|uniref:Carbohydrate ABC transporter membrane protein 2, CUT1 family n=1 Tax=Mahella australiensis (strain DSM 15567 / CIP 107919 / 50-1 BON) TaxID=697281 RepID=F3ZY57_MAHA5|nr:carbohydrate ABC transporter permease [Mahella australiensis]AEE97753.1 carbohydrate ABC transporter membrane protein 2, CUT1 family [Mahella australiensis 50-1 BON]